MNINDFPNQIYDKLKKYVEGNSKYNPYVLMRAIDKKYPLIIFENSTNLANARTIDNIYRDRAYAFNIQIIAINQGDIDSIEICDELSQLVDNVMNEYYKMNGGISNKLYNVDSANATRYILQYNCRLQQNYKIIY